MPHITGLGKGNYDFFLLFFLLISLILWLWGKSIYAQPKEQITSDVGVEDSFDMSAHIALHFLDKFYVRSDTNLCTLWLQDSQAIDNRGVPLLMAWRPCLYPSAVFSPQKH